MNLLSVRFVGRSLAALFLSLAILTGLMPRVAHSSAAMSGPSTALIFIENAGQFSDEVRFQVRGGDLTLWLAEDAIWLTVVDQATGMNVKLTFPGANPHPHLEPFNRLETHVSFFTGSDPAKWRADVPAWGGVRYVDLYPGIDLELTGEQGWLAPRLVAGPGADLGLVRLRVEGAGAVAAKKGTLRMSTAAGHAVYALPLLGTEDLAAEAAVLPCGALAFEVSAPFAPVHLYRADGPSPDDNSADLLYGTFLGGSDGDSGHDIAVDGNGAVYITGYTYSSDLPVTPGAFDTSHNGGTTDVFVAKLNAAGSALVYATFLGGSNDEEGRSIAVNGSGVAYITGFTHSSGFPTTPGAFDTTFNPNAYFYDAFVVKLNAAGSALAYSTFLGGDNFDYGYGIAVSGSGTAYVTGVTWSTDFPTTPGAFDTSFNDGGQDVFVVKLNAAGSALAYSTFLGGSGSDWGNSVAVDGSEAAYVTGGTGSFNLPTTPGAFDTTHNGLNDAFAIKLNAAGSALDYSTFVGGLGSDRGDSIVVDGSGAVYITGMTQSTDLPTTPGAFDTTPNGNNDAFVAKLNAAGSALDYATFLGGGGDDWGYNIAIDGSGAAYISGETGSSNFRTVCGAFDTTHNGLNDAFAVKLNSAGSALAYATFLGGSSGDIGYGIAVDGSGAAYVTGLTSSSGFPTTPGAFDTTYNGGAYSYDAYVAKLGMVPSTCSYVHLPMLQKH